ncbi:DUF1700 domain-containing protein [Lactococcus paracarnosus]|uniref:DUF1700 domain-containing protein n=1 Tax=Pseudolactococcus paracarnosus TaxID=2749962 RepID=A0A7L4WBK2_9LACT|nr:DUF1700 domain-containing protein [Lactococcus paracarnosus]SPC36078.1 Similar to membrane protein [Lactococcus piscium]MCJ1976946.1 DUF1700 domain-containing protein [Lactococcus paracarnosus]MCJ1983357.1 DUF1700 domain-containing protein [Lactococcus paracarnosus]MCJ1993632.1 DUF1700 domain-containing protein [Lactococcus paracarnosus]MCJ1998450.1 DUF1700 domain-containing protein [Lactococcus paracarnosus]
MSYIQDLASYLTNLPQEDREDALFYYEQYIYEGKLTDGQAVSEFGTPKQLARRLVADYYMGDAPQLPEEKAQSPFTLARVVILALFASPILIPVMIAALAVIFSLMIAFASLVLAVFGVILGFLVAAIVSVIGGVIIISQSILGGLFYVTFGLALFGLVILGWPLAFLMVRWLKTIFMWLIKWVGKQTVGKKGVRHES